MTLEQLSAAATQSLSYLPIYKEARKRMIADMTGADLDEHIAAVTTEHVIAYLHRTGQLVAVAGDAVERVKAEARDKTLDEAAGELERLDGFGEWWDAAQAIRALKSPKPPIL